MITFKQYLEESRSAPLYHATAYMYALQIMDENNLRAQVTHMGVRDAVSLTRSIRTAWDWKETKGHGVIFELDQRKLNQTHSIKPIEIEYEWKGSYGKRTYVNKSSQLFEEYVTKDIKPLNRYLVAIHVSKKLKDRMIYYDKDAEEFFGNPLIKVHNI